MKMRVREIGRDRIRRIQKGELWENTKQNERINKIQTFH